MNKVRLVFPLVTLALVSACGSSSTPRAVERSDSMGASASAITLTRDDTIGAKYAAPGPRVCSTHAEPRSGSLTAEQARAYVICGVEGVTGADTLTLLSNVVVEQIAERAYNPDTDAFDAIATDKSVYEIRGHSTVWTCVTADGVLPHDQLCSRQDTPSDSGRCYQTTLAEWRCSWSDPEHLVINTDTRSRVAPPTSEEAN